MTSKIIQITAGGPSHLFVFALREDGTVWKYNTMAPNAGWEAVV